MRYALIGFIFGLIGIGCAHGLMRGSVAMKINDQDAHICMGDNEVKSGDRVNLFENECSVSGSGRSGAEGGSCTKVKIGEGSIIQTLNKHYSVMRVDSGVSFAEGTVVEKKQ